MHTFFELEDIYGLRFEKVGDVYQLVFAEGEGYSNPSWIKDGIAQWTNKRNELQPDINDSAESIADKKEKYALWKARYPYDLGEDMQKQFALMDDFHKNTASLISQNRKSITTFSEFFKSLLALDTESVIFHTAIGEVAGIRSAIFTINLDYIMNASVSVQKAYICFRECWQDMKQIGIEIEENPIPIDGVMHISMSTPCPQIIALFEEYDKLQVEKVSPAFDEEAYKMKIEDTMRMFRVPVEEYV